MSVFKNLCSHSASNHTIQNYSLENFFYFNLSKQKLLDKESYTAVLILHWYLTTLSLTMMERSADSTGRKRTEHGYGSFTAQQLFRLSHLVLKIYIYLLIMMGKPTRDILSHKMSNAL